MACVTELVWVQTMLKSTPHIHTVLLHRFVGGRCTWGQIENAHPGNRTPVFSLEGKICDPLHQVRMAALEHIIYYLEGCK